MEYSNKVEKRFNWENLEGRMIPVEKPYNPLSPNGDMSKDRLGLYPGTDVDGADGLKYRIVACTSISMEEFTRSGWVTHRLFYSVDNGAEWLRLDKRIKTSQISDETFRNMSTGAKVDDATACNADGTLKAGFCTDIEWFILPFAMNVQGLPAGIGINKYIYAEHVEILNNL